MKPLNHALQVQIEALAQLCCDSLERKLSGVEQQAAPIIEALVRNGYSRLSDLNLQARVEVEAVERCRQAMMNHRDELTGITKSFQRQFDDLVRWKTSAPKPPSGTEAANSTSATDA